MRAAPRVLWSALVALWDETIILIGANLVWTALAIPLYLAMFIALQAVGAFASGSGDATWIGWTALVPALLLPQLPTPGGVGLGAMAQVATGGEVPRFSHFRAALRREWRRSLLLWLIGFVVAALLGGNAVFYATILTGWPRLATILWAYGLLFWLALQVYLVPLLLHLPEPRLADLYRRAALLTLAHPFFTATLAVALLLVAVLGLVVPIAYPLVVGAYAALVHQAALRHLRRLHGDLPARDGLGGEAEPV